MSELFDIAVIGGGVNGAGIARDAAGRGAKVLLLEAHDLAGWTSSASTKLIHGGLRYLEYYEFSLVREALQEREALWRIAPHIIEPLRFVLPHREGLRPAWILRLGLFLYDHIGGRELLPATETVNLVQHPAGGPLRKQFRRGFEYSDCRVDDARLVVLNTMDAARNGAEIRTRTALTGAMRERTSDGECWRIEAGRETFLAKAMVNAAGPGVGDVLSDISVLPAYGIRRVRGSHIVTRKLFDHPYAYIFQRPDTRVFFVIPYRDDYTLIGTTDADHTGPLDDVGASAAEIDYLCEGVNEYFQAQITPDDVVWSYAGVRPLIDDGSGRPEAATRGYKLHLSDTRMGAPLLTVYGGKITSYRHLSEEAVGMLAGRLPSIRGPAWTLSRPLPGGDFPVQGLESFISELAAKYSFLGEKCASRIARGYGTRAYDWLRDVFSWEALGEDFGSGLTKAEVDYLVANEWAQTADDILWRRTKLGLQFDAVQIARLSAYLDGQK